MKIFLAYLVIAFLGGITLTNLRLAWRVVILLGLCILVSVAFYFFNKA